MNSSLKFAVVGGDMRFLSLAKGLFDKGYDVTVSGFEKHNFEELKLKQGETFDIVRSADIIILPLAFSLDDVNINAPFSDKDIEIKALMKNISNTSLVLAGKVSNKLKKLADERNIKLIDYLEREEMAILNAVPTAEGAIELAMSEMPITLWGSKVLICGFGRIGKVLAKDLAALGAEVTVACRSHSDFAWIKVFGYKTARYRDLVNTAGEFDLIINTVPHLVIDEKILEAVKEGVLIIDLASKPGGIDFAAAGRLRRKVIWALSLPGKVAPLTAGRIIEKTILNIVEEEGF